MNSKAAINTIARYEARDAVKAELRAQGHKLRDYAPREITLLAHEYLAQHPEVFDQAAEIVRRANLRSAAQRKRS